MGVDGRKVEGMGGGEKIGTGIGIYNEKNSLLSFHKNSRKNLFST